MCLTRKSRTGTIGATNGLLVLLVLGNRFSPSSHGGRLLLALYNVHEAVMHTAAGVEAVYFGLCIVSHLH